jgi:hypothetical protein
MILAELPNSLAIAVTSDTWRVERLLNNVPLLACFIIQLYNRPQLYTFRLIVPIRLYKRIIAVFGFSGMIIHLYSEVCEAAQILASLVTLITSLVTVAAITTSTEVG